MNAMMWDADGRPQHPHPPCPGCAESGEVGSHFDDAWCCACGWRGSLTHLHLETYESDTPPAY